MRAGRASCVTAILLVTSAAGHAQGFAFHVEHARALQAEGRTDRAALALHRASRAPDRFGDEREATLVEVAAGIDPMFERRRELERELGARLAGLAEQYRADGLPRSAAALFEHAAKLDPTIGGRARAAWSAVGGDEDRDAERDAEIEWAHWAAYHRSCRLIPSGRRFDARAEATRLDARFEQHSSTRVDIARRLAELAREYAGEELWRTAFSIVDQAMWIEPDVARELGRDLGQAFRSAIAKDAKDARRDVFRRARSKRGWRKKGKDSIVPPPLDARSPALLLARDELAGVDVGLSVDLDFEGFHGGAGPVFGAVDDENFWMIDVNSQGIGMQLVVVEWVEGERVKRHTFGTVPLMRDRGHAWSEVHDIAERVFHSTYELGFPLRVYVEDDGGDFVVSTLLGELFRETDAGERLHAGYGLARVRYSKPARRRRNEPRFEFSGLLVDSIDED